MASADISVKTLAQLGGEDKRLEELQHKFRTEFGGEPEFFVKVPGRYEQQTKFSMKKKCI